MVQPPIPPIILLHGERLLRSDLNAIKVAEFMGSAILPVSVDSIDAESLRGKCLILSAEALCELFERAKGGWNFQSVSALAAAAFVYGFEQREGHGRLLQELTAGEILGAQPAGAGRCRFSVDRNARPVCRQFAGLSFVTDPGTDMVFVEGKGRRPAAPLVRADEQPILVTSEIGTCRWMLSAPDEIADLDQGVPRGTSILSFFPALAPLMMFIGAESGSVWHNDRPAACFIVDDPLLKKRYGFLDYRKLLEVMQRARFCTSIAFIPWNYRRSDRAIAQLFAAHPDRYSLCTHGCDHTKGEFGAGDYQLLRGKSQTALERMLKHQRFSGLGFDDVMVFPQGIFSTTGMRAVKACNYLAAVNSTLYPVDTDEPLALRELLDVAVMRFSDCPLFVRRSPDKLAELAFDLFLGKPALVVEHHGYFRDGYGDLAEFAKQLNGLDDRLQWASLGEVCSSSCLKRVAADGTVGVRFFTDRFVLKNTSGETQNYNLIRRGPVSAGWLGISLDGVPLAFQQDAGDLRSALSLKPGQSGKIAVKRQETEAAPGRAARSPLYQAKVFVRRGLCEFRDNYVERSRFAGPLRSTARVLFGASNDAEQCQA